MRLDNTTFLGRMLRRTGKFGIALLMMVAFLIAALLSYAIPAYLAGRWYPKLTVFSAFGAAYGIYALFDRFELIPDDTEKHLALSLEDPPIAGDDRQPD